MRQWSLRLFLLDEDGNERPGDVFTKVVYNLHPTFENPTQSESHLSFHDPVPSFETILTLSTFSLHEAPLHLLQRGLG